MIHLALTIAAALFLLFIAGLTLAILGNLAAAVLTGMFCGIRWLDRPTKRERLDAANQARRRTPQEERQLREFLAREVVSEKQ
jgi:hypothetical protein